MKTLSSKTLLAHFCGDERADKKFCFILGSGASKPSGIKTGAELVKQWLLELEVRYSKEELDVWYATEGISKDDPAAHYPKIFDKRFGLNKKDGYAFLETLMENIEPSCGYSVLAQIMTQHPHNIVITPNFDSLTEDALFIYTQKKPLVVGHESLAHFIKPFVSRPLIIKIHHDVLLSPKNSQQEIDELAKGYAQQLKSIFRYYTPIVVGYGGNDGSLMGFLEKLEQIEGGMFWCYRDSDGEPGKRILDLLEKLDGHAVPVKGFDELMIQIGERLKLERLDNKVLEIAEQRAKKYREQIDKISKADHQDVDTASALSKMMERGEKDWLYYELRARKEKDIDKCDSIYKEGLQQLPFSPELHENYAIFLDEMKKNYSEAEKHYRLALEYDPKDASYLGNFASFLSDILKDYFTAEKYFKFALEADSKDVFNLGNYAKNLIVQEKFGQAKQFLKQAFEYNKNEEYRADLELELWLYAYAVFSDEYPESQDKIDELLSIGIRSPGWYLKDVLEVAEKRNHPDFDKLCEYGRLIMSE